MNQKLLRKHIAAFHSVSKKEAERFTKDTNERAELIRRYRGMTRHKILSLSAEGLYDYVAPLWAMRIWGNKQYVVDKLIDDNGLKSLREALAELVWSKAAVGKRWDSFRGKVKGMGPAMISEILCKSHPDDCMLWNRRAYVALNYLEVEGLPRYDYQLTGAVYEKLCGVCRKIGDELAKAKLQDTTLLAVDYFFWDELQVEENLSRIHTKRPPKRVEDVETTTAQFIHNEVRDKLRDVGEWLGFRAQTERKVSEGSKVDTVWEATIGNMGRVIYVFEVQTKGSIDSLILNLLKSLNNPAVQGVVAVSDSAQLQKIRAHADGVPQLRDKLRYWDYEQVLRVHEGLEFVNSNINELGLVPEGF